jgi:hypothetical protein
MVGRANWQPGAAASPQGPQKRATQNDLCSDWPTKRALDNWNEAAQGERWANKLGARGTVGCLGLPYGRLKKGESMKTAAMILAGLVLAGCDGSFSTAHGAWRGFYAGCQRGSYVTQLTQEGERKTVTVTCVAQK